MFIHCPTETFGLDMSDLSLKAVQIKRKNNIKRIEAINEIQVPNGLINEGIIKDKEKVSQLIHQLIYSSPLKFKGNYAVVSLPEPKTFIKVIEIKKNKIQANNLNELIEDELPRHIPINIEDVQIDWEEVGENKYYKKFLVASAPTNIINSFLETLKLAKLNVMALEAEAQAIERCIIPVSHTKLSRHQDIKQKYTGNKIQIESRQSVGAKIVLDLGATRTSIILIDKGSIQFANSIADISGEKITQEIKEKKKLTYQQAEKAKIICGANPKKCKGEIVKIIDKTIDKLTKKIIETINFYQDHFGAETDQIEIILCGGGANLYNIDKNIKDKLKKNVKIANPLINIHNKLNKNIKNIQSYTTAIGLALREVF